MWLHLFFFLYVCVKKHHFLEDIPYTYLKPCAEYPLLFLTWHFLPGPFSVLVMSSVPHHREVWAVCAHTYGQTLREKNLFFFFKEV